MFKNRLKELARKGQPAVGSWIGFRDPCAAEIMGHMGFDFLVIDAEHWPIGSGDLVNILMALKESKSVPIVRLMNNQPDYFKVALDQGAQGLIVPMVQSADDARRAVEHCYYPPRGKRGFGPGRAAKYWLELNEYIEAARDEIMLIALIETIQALPELDAIMAVEGIDGIVVGAGDLASSMNMPGKHKSPEVKEIVIQIMDKARNARMPFGAFCGTPEEFMEYVERGATLVTIAADVWFMMQTASDCIKRTRSLLEGKGLKPVQIV